MYLDDRADYKRFLVEVNLTEEIVQRVTHSSEVAILECGKVTVAESKINGYGLFPFAQISAGDVIAPVLLAGQKTEAGRYTNHSGSPNAKIVILDKDNINLVATRDIDDEEITTDYQETLRVQGLKRIS